MRRFLALLLLLPLASHAALNLDRTRVVFYDTDRAESLTISNGTSFPYLAQAWIEDADRNKILEPLTVLPPLQRINGEQKKTIKITRAGDNSQLPSDRESLFYLNVLEVPPKSENSNTMQLALQSVIKIFYRPKALTYSGSKIWQRDIKVSIKGDTATFQNPSPYFVVLAYIGATNNVDYVEKSFSLNLAPFAESTVKLKGTPKNSLLVGYVNDFGGFQIMDFKCVAGNCQILPAENE